MTQVRQFYGGTGAPIGVPTDAEAIVGAWRSHRRRLRRWFAGLEDERWDEPTRCSGWTTRQMAQHLVSGAQFLGYTLHQAQKGEPTRLLAGFDAQSTAADTTAALDGLPPAALLEELERADGRVDAECDALDDWTIPAESPAGQVSAHLAVNHFVFDSWVHERDLLLPAGEAPRPEPPEQLVVVAYALALAGAARSIDDAEARHDVVSVHLSDVECHLTVTTTGMSSEVTLGGRHHPDLTAPSGALVDLATGRSPDADVGANHRATVFLDRLASVMA